MSFVLFMSNFGYVQSGKVWKQDMRTTTLWSNGFFCFKQKNFSKAHRGPEAKHHIKLHSLIGVFKAEDPMHVGDRLPNMGVEPKIGVFYTPQIIHLKS